ncbi:hypothetical protein IFVP182_C2130007 [Vibrio parahaemolyticus]
MKKSGTGNSRKLHLASDVDSYDALKNKGRISLIEP